MRVCDYFGSLNAKAIVDFSPSYNTTLNHNPLSSYVSVVFGPSASCSNWSMLIVMYTVHSVSKNILLDNGRTMVRLQSSGRWSVMFERISTFVSRSNSRWYQSQSILCEVTSRWDRIPTFGVAFLLVDFSAGSRNWNREVLESAWYLTNF